MRLVVTVPQASSTIERRRAADVWVSLDYLNALHERVGYRDRANLEGPRRIAPGRMTAGKRQSDAIRILDDLVKMFYE